MEMNAQQAMRLAEESYRRDTLFKRIVDAAAHEAMRHAEHFDSEPDRRDLHHIAVTSALAAVRLVIDNDAALKAMEQERDAYKEQALKWLSPPPHLVTPK